MSLYSICKNVLAETGWPVYPSIASNTDATAQQIFALANTALQSLSEDFNWPHLEVEYNFNTAPLTYIYLWPADFRILSSQSVFNADAYYALKGGVTVQEWHERRYGLLTNLPRAAFRVVYPLGAPALQITPTPTSVQAMVATYFTSAYARTQGGADQTGYMLDTDVSKIPERYVELSLKWRFRRAKGLDFSVELAEFNATVNTQFARYRAQGDIPIGGRRIPQDYIPSGYVRDYGYGQ